MDRRQEIDGLTRCWSTASHQVSAPLEGGTGQADSPEGKGGQHGLIATTAKGAFKIYLVPAMRTRTALATVAARWSDLVAEARQEHEARKQADALSEPDAALAVEASGSTDPAAEPREQQRSTCATPSLRDM